MELKIIEEFGAMVGSEKQVAWATRLREMFLQDINSKIDDPDYRTCVRDRNFIELLKFARSRVKRATRAAWWIENRFDERDVLAYLVSDLALEGKSLCAFEDKKANYERKILAGRLYYNAQLRSQKGATEDEFDQDEAQKSARYFDKLESLLLVRDAKTIHAMFSPATQV